MEDILKTPAGSPGQSRRESGTEGERFVCALLLREGWSILARNFRAGPGEIDIIAGKGNVISFVEVKHWRRHGNSDLHRAVDFRKIRRIIETSKIFLAKERQYRWKHVRYDVFLVAPGKEPCRYEGAFDEST